tara:strand:- start:14555 stop:15745 length:1191 start_codon:yes stop_codon:yes gene_type:complete
MRNSLKAVLINIYKKLTTYDKSLGIIANGVDNVYPERADRFINNSVTAKTCSKIMASYLAGKGFGSNNEIVVDEKNNTTLQKFTSDIAKSFSKQRGVFIHVDYNANLKPSSYRVLPYSHCRLGKKDDEQYNGKIAVSDNWDNAKLKKEEITFIDVFNPKEKVLKAQVEKCKGDNFVEKVQRFKGQVLYVNLDDEYVYALSQIDAVMNDCDSEAQASVYKNRSLRKGFFGKQLVITKPLAGSLEDYNDEKEWQLAQSERENFKNTLKDFMGAENVGDVLNIELEFDDSEKLDDVILFKDISSNINDKVFEYTEKSVFNNILMAYNSIPPALVRPENSVFSASGESIRAMQEVYQDNTSEERKELEQLVVYLMSKFYEPVNDLKLIPLIEKKKDDISQ